MFFPIAIETGSDDTAYGVVVPDLPGCFSAGDTFEEALSNAKEAIEGHVEALLADGAPLPDIKPLALHQADPDYQGWLWAIMDIDLSHLDGPAERVNITLPRRVLQLIDSAAKRAGESRSGFLARVGIKEAQRTAR